MEVETAIPQLAWNGHAKHTPNDASLLTGDNIKHSALISGDYDGMSASDNSDSSIAPPLPTTPPPDYFSDTENRNNLSGLQSGHGSHSRSVESSVFPQDRSCHSAATPETITQAKALSDGDSSGDSGDDVNNDDDELDVLEQLKSCSTSKLIQLQQVQVTESNKNGAHESRSINLDHNAQAEIVRLRKEVASLQEQNQQLLALRSQMDGEIENLTSSLFEEAYKMVNEAKAGKILADKKLADANGKIDALEAEVVALRVLLEHNGADAKVLPPSMAVNKKVMSRKISGLKHQRSHSADRLITSPDHQSSSTSSSQGVELLHMAEVEEQELQDFHSWLEGMSTDSSDPYIQHILDVDVIPCLSFANKQLSDLLVTAVQQNSLQMELISNTTDCPSECALSGAKSKPCQYRMRLKDSDNWHYISLSARNKIATVCNFFMFLRHIQQGLIKTTTKTIYTELCKLRASMHMTRLGVEVKNASKLN